MDRKSRSYWSTKSRKQTRFFCFFFPLFLLLFPTLAHAASAPVDVLHYDAEIKPDLAERSIAGIVQIRFASRVNNLSAVELDAQELVVEEISENGSALRFEATEGRLTVRLAQPARAGEIKTLKIRYRARPTRGLRFYDDHLYAAYNTPRWLVCRFDPGDKATLVLKLTLPTSMRVVANGELVQKTPLANNQTQYVWREDAAIPPYTFGFAAGRFQEVVTKKGKVQLVSFARNIYTPAEIKRIFADTSDMLEFFESRAGVAYPARRYTQVLASGNIMQELGEFTLLRESYGKEILNEPRENWLIAHELAHQWWGNRVSCASWSDFWLNEGFAEFMMSAYREHRFGRDEYDRDMEMARMSYARLRAAGRDRPLAYREAVTESQAGGPIVYDKGALVLNLLRYELGDKIFWAGVRRYTRRHFGGMVVTRDLQKAMEEASGKSLELFFEQWIYSKSMPEISAKHIVQGGEILVIIDALPEPFRTIEIDVAVETERGRYVRATKLFGKQQTLNFQSNGKLLSVRIDDGGRLPFLIKHERPLAMLLYQLAHEPDTAGRADALREVQSLLASALSDERLRAQLKAALAERAAQDRTRLIRSLAAKALAEGK